MASDNLDIIRTYTERFNQRDGEGCGELAAKNGRFIDLVLGMESEGPDGLRDWTRIWLEAFPDAKVEMLTLIGSGDTVVTEGIFRGTHTGDFVTPMGTIPPTGKPIEGRYCNVSQIRDGKIVSGRQYYDGLGFLRQLGVAPGVAPTQEAHPQP